MELYNKFANISIEETGLTKKGTDKGRDIVAIRFRENNIKTLKELFIMDDEGLIQLAPVDQNYNNGQTKGTIQLLRYKYLNEPLNIADILEGTAIVDDDIRFRRIKKATPKYKAVLAIEALCCMGLNYNFALSLQDALEDGSVLLDVMEKVVNCEIIFEGNKFENARNIEKLKTILIWYRLRNQEMTYFELFAKAEEVFSPIKKELTDIEAEIESIKAKKLMLEERRANLLEEIRRNQGEYYNIYELDSNGMSRKRNLS